MMGKYHNKYRIESTRLRDWDYSSPGYYFITICAKDRNNYFGRVVDGIVELSGIGSVAQECWQNIPVHFPHVKLDEFIVMPNHVHGIIIINAKHNVETQNFASLQNNKFGPQSKNLGSIIRGFKIGVRKWTTMNNIDFQWQSGFYEHVIRNDAELNRIRQYIIENPAKWEFDSENQNNIRDSLLPRLMSGKTRLNNL
jgi:putative transposase